MKPEAVKNRMDIAEVKKRYDNGEINREQAQREAQPIINRINAGRAEIAKKYGKKSYPKESFINLMRNSY